MNAPFSILLFTGYQFKRIVIQMRPLPKGPAVLATIGLLLVAAIAVFLYRRSQPSEASMLLVNGVIYTLDESRPTAEAIAIDGDRIVGVGTTREMEASFRAETVVDLEGKAVYPGFIDSHMHLEELGAALQQVNVAGTNSVEEIKAVLAEKVAGVRPGAWIRGWGWDQNRWQEKSFPTHESLDEVTTDHPVYLVRVDGHAVWVNRKAMELAGVTSETPDPAGGRILRDSRGRPTGVFIDRAVEMLQRALPEPTEEDRESAIETAIDACLKRGITEVHDMGVGLDGIDIYKKLIASKRFPIRVYVALDGMGKAWEFFRQTGPDTGNYDGRLTVRAVKLYADGALGSRGAALIEPYSDDPGNRGLTLTTSGALDSAASECLAHGFQLCVHAIGDRANNIVLNAYEKAFSRWGGDRTAARFRIEHAQVLDSSDVPRFHELGVLPMMQPSHCTSDMSWAVQRLGERRARWAYAWRSLLEQGSIIPAGSDAPVEDPNPLLGYYAAITRQDLNGHPEGGWHPEQRMTRPEALKAFTTWGAYAGFQEGVKGSLEPGKWADLVVLSDDIMKIDPRKIPTAKVELTMIAGSAVFSSGPFARLSPPGDATR